MLFRSLLQINNSSAITKGNYLEISLINSNLRVRHEINNSIKSRNNSQSFGAKYSYAFNYKNLYIAPGIFYDYNQAKINLEYNSFPVDYYDNGYAYQSYQLTNSYGVKLKIGYDVTNRFSTFVNAGFQNSEYNQENYANNEPNFNRKRSDKVEGYILGIGLKYSLLKNIDIITSYEATALSLKLNDLNDNDNYKKNLLDLITFKKGFFPSNVGITRIGLAYKF